MQDRHFIAIGALTMLFAVAAGAFGAHALKSLLNPEMLTIWHTAVTYQMVHALGLIAIGMLMMQWQSPLLQRAGVLMLSGIVVFSGSLYALALTGMRMLGAITPLGGLAFLAAWALLAWAAYRRVPSARPE